MVNEKRSVSGGLHFQRAWKIIKFKSYSVALILNSESLKLSGDEYQPLLPTSLHAGRKELPDCLLLRTNAIGMLYLYSPHHKTLLYYWLLSFFKMSWLFTLLCSSRFYLTFLGYCLKDWMGHPEYHNTLESWKRPWHLLIHRECPSTRLTSFYQTEKVIYMVLVTQPLK